jgi:hypothetical protein
MTVRADGTGPRRGQRQRCRSTAEGDSAGSCSRMGQCRELWLEGMTPRLVSGGMGCRGGGNVG